MILYIIHHPSIRWLTQRCWKTRGGRDRRATLQDQRCLPPDFLGYAWVFPYGLLTSKNLRFFVLFEAPEKLQETIFFLWNFRLVKYNWDTAQIDSNWEYAGLTVQWFIRNADLSAIHFLNTSLQFVKRCCIIVKKWQGSKIHVVNPLKIPPENQELLHSVVPMLTFTCICQRFLFAAFLQIGQGWSFPSLLELAKGLNETVVGPMQRIARPCTWNIPKLPKTQVMRLHKPGSTGSTGWCRHFCGPVGSSDRGIAGDSPAAMRPEEKVEKIALA